MRWAQGISDEIQSEYGFPMSESIISLSEFKADAKRLLDQVRDESDPLVLTQNGRARAVVEDYDRYRERERALLMLKLLVQGERDIEEGRLLPQAEAFEEARARLLERASSDG